ncbi:predicted protein [Chaetomium globosum CBS 148.51]|uniref:RING-type domain-containing protein n=1 Tax=Chaetomium globosum (strain ATCC 6205 / CBS 148.51 / DSM 1962 / NBRC 6347 / NRRL 1970) TaxID=306901 RepID=Q2H4Q0_CHAGB|nr:uncharacterized protein CHGG_06365 [Chaetomium globosum CBS 148.51]EAQ89746.1 predicted protein [Chaetomium globosum CBS 148.51]
MSNSSPNTNPISKPTSHPSDDHDPNSRRASHAILAAQGIDPLDVADPADDNWDRDPARLHTHTPTQKTPTPTQTPTRKRGWGQTEVRTGTVSTTTPTTTPPHSPRRREESLYPEFTTQGPSLRFLKAQGVDPLDVAEDEDWEGRGGKKRKVGGGWGPGVKKEEEKKKDGAVGGGDDDEEEVEEEEDEEEDEDARGEEPEESEFERRERELEFPPSRLDYWEPMDDYTRDVRRRCTVAGDEPHRPRGAPEYATWFGEKREEAERFQELKLAMDGYFYGIKPPFARCALCADAQLSLRFVPIYIPRDAKDREDMPDLERGAVLICGHMVCRPCWERVVELHNKEAEADAEALERRGAYPPLHCPVCRVELCHPRCECHIAAHRMPRSLEDPQASQYYCSHWGNYYSYLDDGWMEEMPPVLHNSHIHGNFDAVIPNRCDECIANPRHKWDAGIQVPRAFKLGDLRPGYDE